MTTPIANSSPPQATQLDYSRSAPRQAKRIWRGSLLLLATALALLAWKQSAFAMKQATILFWQRQCLHYTAPADAVVYEEDPAQVKRLSADSRHYAAFQLHREFRAFPPTPDNTDATIALAIFPRCWTRLSSLLPSPAFTLVSISSKLPGRAVIFLHERTSPSGHRRLVCVRYAPEQTPFTGRLTIDVNCEAQVIQPATWNESPSQPAGPVGIEDFLSFPSSEPPHLRIYAGQPDPQDPSHFTIRCEKRGRTEICDGYLRDDETVDLKGREDLPNHVKN